MSLASDEQFFKNIYCRKGDNTIQEYVKDKTFLVTGAAGSIGSALVSMLLSLNAKKVYALDNDETRLERLRARMGNPKRLEIVLADVRDFDSLRYGVEYVDIVYHAAALKHVPLSEYFPLEYIKTNIFGTENLIKLSIAMNVEKFIYVSTDKAVNPINVMGATKLLGEKLTIASNLRRRNARTRFAVVRFGNVLYTRGSVIEIFLNQVLKGNYITITDPEMTRFIMDVEEAVKLILRATLVAQGGEIFILKMPAVRVGDLAEAFIRAIKEVLPSLAQKEIRKKIIGRRPGEKMHEELMTPEEATRSVECDDMYVVLSELVLGRTINFGPKTVYSSLNAPKLDVETVKNILKKFLATTLLHNLEELAQ